MARKYRLDEEAALREYSRKLVPMRDIVRETGRTAEALRRKAAKLGLSLGERERSRASRLVNSEAT